MTLMIQIICQYVQKYQIRFKINLLRILSDATACHGSFCAVPIHPEESHNCIFLSASAVVICNPDTGHFLSTKLARYYDYY